MGRRCHAWFSAFLLAARLLTSRFMGLEKMECTSIWLKIMQMSHLFDAFFIWKISPQNAEPVLRSVV